MAHVLVDVVVGVGRALVARGRAAPLTGVEQETEVGPVGLLNNADDIVAGRGVVLQPDGDADLHAVVANLLEALDLALLLLGVF